MGVNGFSSTQHGKQGAKGYTSGLAVLIIDEISMMSPSFLQELNESLRKSTSLDIDFGGLSVVLSGDFYQMPPVLNPVMYLEPRLKSILPDKSVMGFNLWRKFDKVIYLDENNRFKNDPDWGKGCYFARKGVWLDSFIERMNKNIRNQSSSESTSIDSLRKPCLQFVTPDNNLRYLINQKFVSTFSKSECINNNQNVPIRIAATFNINHKKMEIIQLLYQRQINKS
jgi:hypothetical protein